MDPWSVLIVSPGKVLVTLVFPKQTSEIICFSKEHSQQDISSHNSKTNLQICNSKDDGGSFSFSDLDPVQEDIEDPWILGYFLYI